MGLSQSLFPLLSQTLSLSFIHLENLSSKAYSNSAASRTNVNIGKHV